MKYFMVVVPWFCRSQPYVEESGDYVNIGNKQNGISNGHMIQDQAAKTDSSQRGFCQFISMQFKKILLWSIFVQQSTVSFFFVLQVLKADLLAVRGGLCLDPFEMPKALWMPIRLVNKTVNLVVPVLRALDSVYPY